MSTATGYVIVEVGFEYNDEIYQTLDESGGRAKIFYHHKSRADLACAKLNFEEVTRTMLSGDIGNYGYSLQDIYGYKALDYLEDQVEDLNLDIRAAGWDDDTVPNAFEKLTPDQQVRFVELMQTKFFLVHEVEIGGE
jgi:hypothetical protein